VEELQEQLLVWEDELTQMEEVSVDLEAEQEKTEATQKEYLDKMEATPPVQSTPSASTRCWGRRRSSSMGESGTLTCMRRHWWRHSPETTTPSTTVQS
jgi:hypothetical protein